MASVIVDADPANRSKYVRIRVYKPITGQKDNQTVLCKCMKIKPGRMYPFDERIELRIEIRPVTVSDVHPIGFELNFESYLCCVNSCIYIYISLLKSVERAVTVLSN